MRRTKLEELRGAFRGCTMHHEEGCEALSFFRSLELWIDPTYFDHAGVIGRVSMQGITSMVTITTDLMIKLDLSEKRHVLRPFVNHFWLTGPTCLRPIPKRMRYSERAQSYAKAVAALSLNSDFDHQNVDPKSLIIDWENSDRFGIWGP